MLAESSFSKLARIFRHKVAVRNANHRTAIASFPLGSPKPSGRDCSGDLQQKVSAVVVLLEVEAA
jgi:hypothetical protein